MVKKLGNKNKNFRRSSTLKKLIPLFKGYLVALKSYNPLKDVKENAETPDQRSNPVRNKDHRKSICMKLVKQLAKIF